MTPVSTVFAGGDVQASVREMVPPEANQQQQNGDPDSSRTH